VRRIGERTAAVLIPPGSLAGYTSPAGLKYDPAAARQLLAEAGYPGGKGFPTVDILFNKDGGHDVIAQAIAKDWQENLGVPVSLAQKEIKVFKADLYDHNFMVCRAGWYGDYPDPQTFLDINRTGDGNNDRGYSNPDYDALLDKANNELDPARRLAILSEAERMIVEDELPLIPIFHYVQVTAFDPDRISGITSHPRQEQNIYMIDVLGDGKGAEKPRSIPPPGRQN
jgi:oligopeptide transport system substrate-binding protein